MQKILTINEIKVYSRKQIVAWVQSTNTSTFQQLKNGLFFIKILRKLVPHDIARCKIAEKPINQYEQTQNMNIVKKVLNKHNLQLNMNVQAVVLSKNCFQLANWFKNLYEQNKSDKDTDFHYSEKSHTPSKIIDEISHISNYKSLSRATSSDKKGNNFQSTNNIKKLGRVTSGFIGMTKTQKFTYTLKVPKDVFDSELTYQLFSNSRQLQKEKTTQRSRTLKTQQLRHAKSKSKYPNNNSVNFFNSTFIEKQKRKKSKLTEQDTIANLMKEQALEEQIEGIEKILSKVSQYMNKTDPAQISVEKMRKQIISIIYKIPILSSEEEKQNTCENK